MPPARAPFSLGLALAAALVLLPRWVRAEPEPYQVSYAAPAGCPLESQVRAEVRANVRDAASGDGARIALTIVENGSVFAGELIALDRSGKQGRRSIQGPTCAEVSQTLAFLAALAIELGGRVEDEPAAVPAAPSAPKARTSAPNSTPLERQSSATPRRAWAFSVLLGASARGALAPTPRPALEIGLDWSATTARMLSPTVRATIVGALSRVSSAEDNAKLSLLAARLEACPFRFGPRAVALRPCLGAELGAVFARGELEGGRSVVQRWGSSEAGLHLEINLAPRVFLELNGAAVVPFFRTRYFFVPQRIVYAVPAVTGRAGLTAGFRFQ